MKSMTTDKVKARIQELVPDAGEDFGLAVVLRAIRKSPNGIALCRGMDGDLLAVIPSVGNEFVWDLKVDYDQQSEETRAFIGSLLGVSE